MPSESSARTSSSTAKKPVVLASNRGHCSPKRLRVVEWCALQDSNLPPATNNQRVAEAYTQRDTQGSAVGDLPLVRLLKGWPLLPIHLRTALADIADSFLASGKGGA